MKNAVAKLGEGLQVLDINLEEMDNLEGREDQVRTDPLAVLPSTDQADLLLESEVSNVTSFSELKDASAETRE